MRSYRYFCIGMDIERTIQWKSRGDLEMSNQAFERALEFLDLTVVDPILYILGQQHLVGENG